MKKNNILLALVVSIFTLTICIFAVDFYYVKENENLSTSLADLDGQLSLSSNNTNDIDMMPSILFEFVYLQYLHIFYPNYHVCKMSLYL